MLIDIMHQYPMCGDGDTVSRRPALYFLQCLYRPGNAFTDTFPAGKFDVKILGTS